MEAKKKSESSFQQKVQKMIDTFTKAETLGKENTKKFQDWITDISSPNFKLISNLLNYFLDDLTSTEMRENIFKILRKLYILKKDVVVPQIASNKDFAKAIIVHINKGEKDKISDNCFYMLTQLYFEKPECFEEGISEDFIMALFDGLTLIHEEEIIQNVVKILIEINFNYKNKEENLFLKVHKNNENSALLNEILLRIINNEDNNEKQIKVLKCLKDLMGNQKESIFYESDLESFIDIVLTKFSLVEDNEVRLGLLCTLEQISRYKEYYDGGKYKIDDIREVMEEFAENENYGEEVINTAKQIIENFNSNQ